MNYILVCPKCGHYFPYYEMYKTRNYNILCPYCKVVRNFLISNITVTKNRTRKLGGKQKYVRRT